VIKEHIPMAGSTFGNIFKITTWGESHGKGVGVVVDGCPAGLSLCEEDIQKFLNRRKPGQSKFTTPRKEDDSVEILSGVFEGKTTGTPISLVVYNKNQQSKDYSEIASYYRPGHADYTFDMKYGFRDSWPRLQSFRPVRAVRLVLVGREPCVALDLPADAGRAAAQHRADPAYAGAVAYLDLDDLAFLFRQVRIYFSHRCDIPSDWFSRQFPI